MSTEEPAVAKSVLDKPLHLLTEDDISQLTREDCRRYLKDKGMRRPSWNKSQAIQQVISLKTLFETNSDSDAAGGGDIRRKLCIPRPEHLTRVQKGTSADTEISVSAEESIPLRQKDPDIPDVLGDFSGRCVAADNYSGPPRITGVTDGPVGQMTIFYCGKVNVYDDVPADKAHALMQLAASPFPFPNEATFDGNAAVHSLPCHLQAPRVKVRSDSSAMLSPTSQTVRIMDNTRLHREESNMLREDNAAGGSAIRKASMQRYLEKRKDRFKSKQKIGAAACGSLDVYLSHQKGNQNPNEQSSRSDTCSPPPVRPPNTPNRLTRLDAEKTGSISHWLVICLGAVLMDHHKGKEAIAELARAIAIKADLHLLHLRAAFHEHIGDVMGALRDGRAALSGNPNHQEILELHSRVNSHEPS